MKKIIIFVLIFAFITALLLPGVTIFAFDGSVLSNPSYSISKNGFTYKETTVKEGGVNRKIFYGEYNPTVANAEYEWVIHSISNGTETTLSTVMDIAKNYENTTNRKVMFATNGDFFYATGANVESYVNNGIVITKGNFASKHSIGFDNNGKAAIGRMTEVDVNLCVINDDGRTLLKVDKFNSEPTGNEIAIYNQVGTYKINGANKIIVRSENSSLINYPVNGTSYNMNNWSLINDNEFTLRSGQFAVVTKGEHAEFLDANRYGIEMNLVEVPAGEFEGCTWVVGGYDILVNNGTVGSNFHTDNSGNANRARTLIGIKADGTIFLSVVDERGGSTGITVTKEAELAKAMGAKYALELDGGGSSTSVVRVGETLTLRNTPSDGGMRRVSNAVMLVEKEKPTEDVPGENPGSSNAVTEYEAAWNNYLSAESYENKFAALNTAIEKYNLLEAEEKQVYKVDLEAAIDAYNSAAYKANSAHTTELLLIAKIFKFALAEALITAFIVVKTAFTGGGL